MKKPLTALLLTSALLIPAAPAVGWGMPPLPDNEPGGGPADDNEGSRFKECWRTRHDTTVRIKLRDDGDFVRIRVSHPDGDGRFDNNRVRSVRAEMLEYGRSGAGSIGRFLKDPAPPSFRVSAGRERVVEVNAKFRLRNGNPIYLTCIMR